MNTFVTHPWIFVCNRSWELMHVNNSPVFMPEPWYKYINNAENGVVEAKRITIPIHYPLRSLRDICLWELVFLVETKDEIYDLEIPHSLKVELMKNFRSSSRYNQEEDERDRADRFIM
jgi:von Hippel-Lindau disease tumor supressor